MLVTLNGQQRPLDRDTSVAGLLHDLSLDPIRVAVEVNQELVTRARFTDTLLREGDRIEIVTFVGGG